MSLTVESIMSPSARRIAASTSLPQAIEIMALHQIRHLPVEDNGDILGVLTENVAKISATFSDSSGQTPAAGDVCSRNPYIVNMRTPVAELANEMARHKYDCALVADDEDRFVGIVTLTDLCRTLHLVLSERDS